MILKKLVRFTATTSSKLFDEYLAITNTLFCGGLVAIGDISAQSLERTLQKRKKKTQLVVHDWKRTGRIALLGLALGLPCHGWYFMLDRFLPGRTRSTIIKKIFLDQICFSPAFSASFIIGASCLEGNSLKCSVDLFRSKFLMIFAADCLFWPPAQYVNFYMLPPGFRVMYVNVLAVFWDTFLSYMKHNEISLKSKVA